MKKTVLFYLLYAFCINSNAYAQCGGFTLTNVDLDFGSTAGTFTFPYVASTDIVNGGTRTSGPFSFDIWDETTGASTPGGVNDITFNFSMTTTSDPYGGIIEETTSGTHEIDQSTSGIRGTLTMGSSGATDGTTGDVRCYTVDVDFAPHVHIMASDFTALLTSVNTAGAAYESASVIFKDEDLVPYGTATYNSYFSSPPSGTLGGSGAGTIATNPWTTTGTGVYLAASTGTVDLTDSFNTVAGVNGDDNVDPNAVSAAGLGFELVGGFTYTVCLEDVAATATDGDITTTMTSFTSTLNGIELPNVCLGAIALPVDLVSFTASKTNEEAVALEWLTASEHNSSYFDVEHSIDGRNFMAIASVDAAGNSSDKINYSFLHENPSTYNNYYRLKQVDFDGTYTYSDVRTVRYEKDNSIHIYPTITSNQLNIALDNPSDTKKQISISNLNGKQLFSDQLNEGDISKSLDISFLPIGQYLISFYDENDIVTHRFIKK